MTEKRMAMTPRQYVEHIATVGRRRRAQPSAQSGEAAVELLATVGRLLGAATEWRIAQDGHDGHDDDDDEDEDE